MQVGIHQDNEIFNIFRNVSFESWALELSDREKTNIADSVPAYRISLVSVQESSIVLTLWIRKTVENGSKKPIVIVFGEELKAVMILLS